MKPAPQFLAPRSQVVFAHTRRMLSATSACVRKFALQVAENYIALVAPDQRLVPFRMGVTLDDLVKAEKHNAQIIGRYMDGTVKTLPADLEDAWVIALAEPYRSECERELASRRGRYSEQRLPDGEQGETVSVARLATEFGQLLEALAPVLADGQITDADRPHAIRILRESDDLIVAVTAVRRQLVRLLPEGQGGNA